MKKELELVQFSGKGTIYSFTTVYEAPAGFEKNAPYIIALIRLEEGPLVTAQLTDLESRWVVKRSRKGSLREMKEYDVKIGMQVEMVTRKLNEPDEREQISYGYKFRPVLERSTPEK